MPWGTLPHPSSSQRARVSFACATVPLRHCPPLHASRRFVWSVRDRAMIDNVLDYNTSYADKVLPTALPASFRLGSATPHTDLAIGECSSLAV